MVKTLKIRLLPNKEQEQLMWKHVNCSRFIWNWGLAFQKEQYQNIGKKLSGYDLVKQLTPLKKQKGYEWLNEVSAIMLQVTLMDLDRAYKNFFKSNFGFPKFKSKKKTKKSFPSRTDAIYFEEAFVQIQKLGKIKYKTDYPIPLGKDTKFYNPRIQFTPNGKWILTVGIDFENQEIELTDKNMGIDLGVKTTAVIAFGDDKIEFKNVNKSKRIKKLEKKLKRLQKQVSRKYQTNGNFEKTQNILKLEAKLRKLQYHISNIRQDYNHQMTHKIISMKPKTIIMEDLNIKGMMKNKHLAKSIQIQNFYDIQRQLVYKCEWYGIQLVQVSRWYPSSKTCSCCGSYKSDLKLSNRIYKCPECGLEIDRDYNAAINLMKYVA